MLSNFFAQFMSKFLTAFFTLEFGIFSILGGIGQPLPETPSDFQPVIRFAVCSDIHLSGENESEEGKNNEEHFLKMLDSMYRYAESCEYGNMDALIVAGDMTGRGKPEQYEQFMGILNKKLKDETQLITVLGNHEFIDYRDDDPTVAYDVYKEYVNEEVDTTYCINGYHFVAASYADDAKTFNGKTEWMSSEIEKAIEDTGDKPVFVIQHPHPFNTVYGSVNWSDFSIKTTLMKYPQVIDFSGHSHYTPTDPRTIWQGSFTAVGTGCTACLMGNLNYISGDQDAPGESGTYWIVEADKDGNVRLQLYDIVNDMFFEKNDYYLTDVAKASAHKYTWGNLKYNDTAPEFPEGSQIGCVKNDDGTVSITFPDAEGYWGAENYKIRVYSGSSDVYAGTVISNYVRAVSDGMTVNIGNVDSGTYSVTVNPYSPYAKGGKALSGEITVD